MSRPYLATYHWLHIATGKEGTSVYQGESEREFLVFLNRCNAQNHGQWQYTRAKSIVDPVQRYKAVRAACSTGGFMRESTIHLPHKISSEQTFSAVCAALLKEGILFVARDNGNEYLIELQGF